MKVQCYIKSVQVLKILFNYFQNFYLRFPRLLYETFCIPVLIVVVLKTLRLSFSPCMRTQEKVYYQKVNFVTQSFITNVTILNKLNGEENLWVLILFSDMLLIASKYYIILHVIFK